MSPASSQSAMEESKLAALCVASVRVLKWGCSQFGEGEEGEQSIGCGDVSVLKWMQVGGWRGDR